MKTMNISLSDSLKQYVDETMAEGRYSSVSEYIRELIRADELEAGLNSIVDPDDYHMLTDEQRRKAQDELEATLLEALDEGPPTPFTKQDWIDIRAEGMALCEARKKVRRGKTASEKS